MMSLNKISVWQNIWQQFKWKLTTYVNWVVTLIVIQLVLLLLTRASSGQGGFGINMVNVNEHMMSLDGLFIASVIAIFITSINIGNYFTVSDNFSIVTTRMTANISNILFLLFYSIVAALLAVSILYMFAGVKILFFSKASFEFILPITLKTLTIFVSFTWMVGAIGYCISAFYRVTKWSGVIVVALFIYSITQSKWPFVRSTYEFFSANNNALFEVKACTLACILFALAMLITDRLEVSRG